MSEQIDILVIDNKIRSNFDKQKNNITVYENRLVEIEKSLCNKNTSEKIKESLEEHKAKLSEYINDIKNNVQYNFYVLKTVQLIEEYKKILDEPIKISFLGKPSKMSKEKQQIIKN